MVDRLAHHYSRTERSGKAVEYLSRSAEKAVQGYAHAEAARALEEALPHAERLPAEGRERRVLALVVRLVTSLYFQGRFEEGRDLLLRHQPRVDALGDPQLAGEYYFWLGHIYAHIGDSTGAERFAARAIEEAERAGDGATIGKARHRAGLGGLLHRTVRGGGRACAGGGRGARAHRGVVVARSTPSAGRRSTT